MASQDSTDLLQAAKAGSPHARDLLYERCAGRLLGYIRLRLGPQLRARLESRDILQATLLKSIKHLDGFRGERSARVPHGLARAGSPSTRSVTARITSTGSVATPRARCRWTTTCRCRR